MPIGDKHRYWRDKNGGEVGQRIYEVRTIVDAIAACPTCGKEVELESDTEEWHQGNDGRWYHGSFGPSVGSCCGNLIVDSFDGCKVYYADKSGELESEDGADVRDTEL